jgi:DNA-binding XRE family transcriptional regulator
MGKPINVQTINDTDGTALFIVMPYQDYLRLCEKADHLIPHEVVGLMVQQQLSPVRAWREYFKLTQTEVAERLGITQAALAQLEDGKVKPRRSMLSKIAKALNITVEQLNV